MKFSVKVFSVNVTKFAKKLPADLVTFTEEILNGKLYLLCSATDFINPSF